MIYLISSVICLNNTRGWFYKSSHDGVKEISLIFLKVFFGESDFSKLVCKKKKNKKKKIKTKSNTH